MAGNDSRDRPEQDYANATPDTLRKRILARFPVRVHICLILATSFLVGLAITKLLLMSGVHQMWIRYAVALFVAYLAFLGGVWIWLRLAGFDRRIFPSRRRALDDAGSALDFNLGGGGRSSGGGGFDLPFRGGGGGSGGGGASASFGDSANPGFSLASSGGSSSGGGGFDLDIDDGWVIVAGIALLAAVFGGIVYIVYAAPTILADAAFAGMLSAGLVRSTRHIASGGWVASVVGHTWVAFTIVLVLAMIFAYLSHRHFPEARTLFDVIKSL